MRSAIAEAAGMTGFERNGDVVQFASYAPLLARRDHTQWHPDLIYFSGTEVFRTANYYVQQLFGQNSGDACLPTSLGVTNLTSKLATSAVRDTTSGDVILKIVNGADAPAAVVVALEGLGSKDLRTTRTILTGESPDAFNEDAKEPAVKPVTEELTLNANFEYEAPANSLTVFRLRK